jgi:hypothetical protein
VEVENAALGEIGFVQVKSAAEQDVLGDYVGGFNGRRGYYARMISLPRAQHWTQTAVGSLSSALDGGSPSLACGAARTGGMARRQTRLTRIVIRTTQS